MTAPTRPDAPPLAPLAHRRTTSAASSRASSIPSSAPRSSTSGMVHDVAVEPERRRHGEGRAHHRRPARCGARSATTCSRRSRACRASARSTVEYDEMTQDERSALMQQARLRASQSAPADRGPADDARDRGRQRQGRRRQVVDHRQPRGRARGARPHRRRARRRHLGLLDPAHARRAAAASRARRADDGKGKIVAATR